MFETKCADMNEVHELNEVKFKVYQEEGYTWTIEHLEED